ncbi:MAG TPA: hypothetical protein VHZ04_01865 [Candidatus Paceibacterota bacterium]|jgi:hypothetical protein|nr:hypothetical protein [Candidatus Paceibacterota bacterium]
MASFEIKWEAPEFEYREKGVSWYWLSIIIAAIIVAFSVWEKNFLFGLFIVLAEVLFIVWGNRTPRMISFTANETSITIDDIRSYSFRNFETMSVDTPADGFAEMVFVFRARFKTPLKILFPAEHLAAFRANTKTILKEVPYEPTLLDSIEKLLRF